MLGVTLALISITFCFLMLLCVYLPNLLDLLLSLICVGLESSTTIPFHWLAQTFFLLSSGSWSFRPKSLNP